MPDNTSVENNTRFDIHVCLVSGQPTPNLTPILSDAWRPKKVILIVSEQMKPQAEWLRKVLKRHGVKCDIEEIGDVFDIQAISSRLEQLLKQYENKKIAFNITGGTKPMAIAAQSVAFFNSQAYFYVNHNNNEIQLHTTDGTDDQIIKDTPKIKLTLRDYLDVHGYEILSEKKEEKAKRPSVVSQLMQTLVNDAKLFSDAIGSLNWIAKEASESQTLQYTFDKKHQYLLKNENFNRVLDWFKDADLIQLKGSGTETQLHFKTEDARNFANGGWLEDYVFGIVKDIKNTGKNIQEIAENMEVKNIRHNSTNELDVLFLARNRLHLIECKTRKFAEDGDKSSDTLYKLDSLTELGGLNTKGMLISFRGLDQYTLQRAKDLGIEVIKAEQLWNLENQIRTWISR